jgi:hypothetical protein
MRETKLINNGISFNFLVNDNGNQYKQKLILWYWTTNYFLMGFTASKIYFYFGTFSMFWNLKATISHEFQYLKYCFFYLRVQRELEVLCSKNIIHNFIPMVKMFWLSGTADYFEIDYHWQQMLALKLILWYWTTNYFLMGFTASKIYFYFGTISMFWNLKATISHEFQYSKHQWLSKFSINEDRIWHFQQNSSEH